ncbi:MAG: Uroporphyrinogen decarboxylase [Candidatus Heimdallarchaeota archaeon LC_2]|nr:MAG: Uroporphyrinogen decarboxylase [Candidatus Heimdallarchaeota archaeon LC_2]
MKNSKDLILDAFNGQQNSQVPIWFMRQAGRYLPEYRKFREGKTFEEMAMTPENAAKVTLQPIRRYDLDAAIIFSDILIPLYGMDRGLEIVPQVGPVLEKPLKNPEDVKSLKRTSPKEDFPYLKESIQLVRKEIPDKALFGFAGAPFTLASYLIEGKSTRNALLTKTFAYKYPDEFSTLLNMLADIVIDQLQVQIEGGADVIQLFDSWAGFLSASQYEKWILPHVQKIFLKFDNTPNILYGRGSSHLLPIFQKSGAKGISIDSTLSLIDARSFVGNDLVIQGNLDPAVLLTNPRIVENHTKEVLKDYTLTNNPRYIFNLAQGIDKTSKLENVEMMINTVKEFRLEE